MSERKISNQVKCFHLYFRDAFVEWFSFQYPKLEIRREDKVILAKKMWEKMVEERNNSDGKFIMDGDEKIKFNVTTSTTNGSKNYKRFLEEKERVIGYMKKHGKTHVDEYLDCIDISNTKHEKDKKIQLWNAKVSELEEEDYIDSFFDSENMILTQLQSKYIESLTAKDITLFADFLALLEEQQSLAEKAINEQQNKIINHQKTLTKLQKRRMNFATTQEKGNIMLSALKSNQQVKKQKTIEDFDPIQFMKSVEEIEVNNKDNDFDNIISTNIDY